MRLVQAEKRDIYQQVLAEARELIRDIDDPIANLANVSALLREKLGFFWVGFYFLRGDRLVLGPFQGSPACVYLPKPEGVCWAAVLQGGTVVVPDVHRFPGHIACDPRSKSEIVVPLRDMSGAIRAVLDVDSDRADAFDEEDQSGLEELAELLTGIWHT